MEMWSIIEEPSSCPGCDRARARKLGVTAHPRGGEGGLSRVAPKASPLARVRRTKYEVWPLRRRPGPHELVDDRIHQRLERGVDDVGRDADRGPALPGLILALDQDAGHRLGAAIENAHAVVGQLEPADVALILAQVLAQRQIERVDGPVAFR